MLSCREPPPSPAARFGSVVVRTQLEPHAGDVELTGALEDRGTGEQRAVAGGHGPTSLVTEWATRSGLPP